MSGTVAETKRLLQVTAGNVQNHHIYVANHYDFFPADALGGPNRREQGKPIRILLDGLDQVVETDIGCDRKSGKPRRMFRGRAWVRQFFEHHDIKPGDVLAIVRADERTYRLYPFHAYADRNDDWTGWLQDEPEGDGPTVIELFAGCGGMALGFKRAGFRTVLANEWDAAACETLQTNITPRVAQCAIEEVDRFPKADVVAGGPPCQGFSNLG